MELTIASNNGSRTRFFGRLMVLTLPMTFACTVATPITKWHDRALGAQLGWYAGVAGEKASRYSPSVGGAKTASSENSIGCSFLNSLSGTFR